MQRTALVRSLVKQPKILLLDEPLGALDPKTREQTQLELIKIQSLLDITFIMVTHDQEEAMAISDRVAVMNKGKIEQIAAPDELYHSPASEFVANFVGQMNRLPATLRGAKANVLGTSVDFTGIWQETPEKPIALVRPEALTIKKQAASNGQVFSRAFLGPLSKVTVELADGIRVDVTDTSDASAHLRTGDKVKVSLKPGHYLVVAG